MVFARVGVLPTSTLPTLLLLERPLPATAPERDDPALYDAEKLRAWRAESGLSREQVCAEIGGLSYPWLAKLEQGQPVQPSLKLLVALARFYGHDPGELIPGGAQ